MADIEDAAGGAKVAKPKIAVKLPKVTEEDIAGFKAAYNAHVAERAAERLPPLPIDPKQAQCVVRHCAQPPAGDEKFYFDLLANRVPPGVDDASYVKANFLNDVSKGTVATPIVSRLQAIELLGTMQGGYNVMPLIDALDFEPELADAAVKALSGILLMFDAFFDVNEKMNAGNQFAKKLIESWANGEWFTNKPTIPEKLTVTVFKVTGETNTDDLSPAPDAWSRPDIPLHALAMLKIPREGITDCRGQIEELQKKGHAVAYVGDVVGTGSSRKSATNSVLWYTADDIPFVPNKRAGGVCIGTTIAPIFFQHHGGFRSSAHRV